MGPMAVEGCPASSITTVTSNTSRLGWSDRTRRSPLDRRIDFVLVVMFLFLLAQSRNNTVGSSSIAIPIYTDEVRHERNYQEAASR
jgi:hypothetical protein